jgi:hypothetical protein
LQEEEDDIESDLDEEESKQENPVSPTDWHKAGTKLLFYACLLAVQRVRYTGY